jgi:O-antigen/teichoic acid export membrane protein
LITKIKSLKSDEGFVKYFKNTSWLLAEKIFRIIVGLFVGVWVARYLGPDQFGLLSYAQSFVGLFTAIATLGLDGIIVRELVKDESKRDKLLGTSFKLKLIGGITAILFLAVAVNFTSNDAYTNLLVFIIASATIFQSFNVIDFYFQAKVLSKYVVLANIISLFLSSIVKIILILYEAPLIAFAWAVLFDSVVLAIGFVHFYSQNHLSFKDWKFENRTAINLAKDSWPLILSGIVVMIQARIDQVMLKEMVDTKEVGYYSVALRLIEVFGFIPIILNNSLFPALANAKNISEETYKYRFLNYYRLSFLLFIITAIPIFIFAEQVTILLYGIEYQPAGALLSLMAIRLFFTNTGVARGSFINIENLFRFSLITMTFGTIVNVVLNYILIPHYQSHGAIIASIISFFITTFLIDIIYQKTRGNVFLQLKGMLTFYKINPSTKIV